VDPPLLRVELIDDRDGRLLGESLREIAVPEVLGEARARAAELLEQAGFAAMARITVRVTPADAEVSLSDGTAGDPGKPKRFTVAPGRFVVRVKREGYAAREVVVSVVRGAETNVEVELMKLAESETSIVASPWFWTAIGAAVIGGATAAIVAFANRDPNH